MEPEELLGNTNEPKKNGSPLKSLETDLVLFSDSIKETADDIMEELSKYPIFIAHQHEARIGELIIDKDERAVSGKCGCNFYQQNKMMQGPCEHMLALRLNRANRQWASYWQKISKNQQDQLATSV